ncbi:nonribosomal peptide synthase [Penicillium maclennaniae]|uniref:nonribosomal peptide synthase n=1 Tax=Penicillium maclennaniae TaxID=1343394 RepID=UPI00253F9785|nr:nonribosomal peptide synthase [Penicillium maclennaniae]KAJ5668555.1 nonribosomal peptide synthase [Penicillium maclennaniae]
MLSKVAQRTRPDIQTSQESQAITTQRPYSLSPIQQMFLDTITTKRIPGFSHSFLLQVKCDIEPEELDRTVKGKWSQYISGDVKSSYNLRLHEVPVDEDVVPTLTKACRERLNPGKGPAIACEVFKCAGKKYLFLAAHHLVIDLVSWRIILKDLELLLRLKDLPPFFSLSFPEWCFQQKKWSSANLQPDRVLFAQLPVPRYDYWGMADEANTYGMAKIYTASINSASSTKILALCANNGRLELQDILIVALVITFKRVFSDRELPPIFLEHHGREPWLPEIDITQTTLRISSDVPETVAGGFPLTVWEFFSSTFLHPQGRDAFHKLLRPEIMLNFEGFFQQLERADGMFEIAQVDGELADMSPEAPRLALLEFAVQVQNGRIGLSCIYNQKMRHTDRVEQCMREFAQFLTELPDMLSGSTPATFPESR